MTKHCCYGMCNSDSRYQHREYMKNVFFMPFPKPKSNPERCREWISLCGRPYETFNENKITKDTYICSKHFVGCHGPTDEYPNPLPALHIDHSKIKKARGKIIRTSLPYPKKKNSASQIIADAAESLIRLSGSLPINESFNYGSETTLIPSCSINNNDLQDHHYTK